LPHLESITVKRTTEKSAPVEILYDAFCGKGGGKCSSPPSLKRLRLEGSRNRKERGGRFGYFERETLGTQKAGSWGDKSPPRRRGEGKSIST